MANEWIEAPTTEEQRKARISPMITFGEPTEIIPSVTILPATPEQKEQALKELEATIKDALFKVLFEAKPLDTPQWVEVIVQPYISITITVEL